MNPFLSIIEQDHEKFVALLHEHERAGFVPVHVGHVFAHEHDHVVRYHVAILHNEHHDAQQHHENQEVA